jgi:hypothetical protein
MVVDAGGEPWERVEPLVARRIDELPGAAVLELLSTRPGVRASLVSWCTARGHAVDQVRTDASVVRIRKNPHPLELT